MNQTFFPVWLRERLEPEIFPIVFQALIHNRIIWDGVQNQRITASSLHLSSGKSEDWNPARLSLILISQENEALLTGETSFDNLSDELIIKSNNTLEYLAGANTGTCVDLNLAGLAALAIRRQNTTSGNAVYPDQLNLFSILGHEQLVAILACLFGMYTQESDLLGWFSRLPVQIAVDTLLCQPFSEEQEVDFIQKWLAMPSVNSKRGILGTIAKYRPVLVNTLPEDMLTESNGYFRVQILDSTIEKVAAEIFDNYTSAGLFQTSGEHQLAIEKYQHTVAAANHLQSVLFTRIAQIFVANDIEERLPFDSANGSQSIKNPPTRYANSVESWERATDLWPENVYYHLGLIQAQILGGNIQEAKFSLNNLISSTSTDHDLFHEGINDQEVTNFAVVHPAISIASGLVNGALEKNSEARSEFKKAFSSSELELGKLPSPIELLNQLFKLGLFIESNILARDLLLTIGENHFVRSIFAQTTLKLGNAPEAVVNSSLLYSLEKNRSTHKLYIEALRLDGQWSVALNEQKALITSQADPTRSDYHIAAWIALQAWAFEECEHYCAKLLNTNSSDGLAYQILAELALKQNNLTLAQEYLEKAVNLSPDEPGPWVSLCNVYKNSDQKQAALETLRVANKSIPASPEIKLLLGMDLLETGNPSQAVELLEQAAWLLFEQEPNLIVVDQLNGMNWYHLVTLVTINLASTYRQLGYIHKALDSYAQLCSTDGHRLPDNPQLAFDYAITLAKAEKEIQALGLFKIVREKFPHNLPANLEYARLLARIPDQPVETHDLIMLLENIINLQKSSETQSHDEEFVLLNTEQTAEVYTLLAESLVKASEPEKAFNAFEQALNAGLIRQPEWRFRHLFGMGKVASELGNLDIAIATLVAASNLQSNHPELIRCLTDTYEKAGLVHEAYQTAQLLADANPDDVSSLTWVIDKFISLMDHPDLKSLSVDKQALKLLEHSIALAPEKAGVIVRMAQFQAQRSNPDLAIASLDKLFDPIGNKLDMKVMDLVNGAMLLRKLGQIDSAIRLLLQANQLDSVIRPALPAPGLITGREVGEDTQIVIWKELALAYYQKKDLENALNSINTGICLAPGNADLYQIQIEILLESAELNAAKGSLELILKIESDNPEISLQLALLHYELGNFPKALKYSEEAYLLSRSLNQLSISNIARWLNLEFARAVHHTERVLQEPLAFDDKNLLSNSEFVIAETALEINNADLAATALGQVIENLPYHPRTLLLQARLLYQQEGISNQCKQLYSSAFQEDNKSDMNTVSRSGIEWIELSNWPDYYQKVLRKINEISNSQALLAAAIDFRDWFTANELSNRLLEMATSHISTYLTHIIFITLRAEHQRRCEQLMIVQHAPGEVALRDSSLISLNQAAQAAMDLINAYNLGINLSKNSNDEGLPEEIRISLRDQVTDITNSPGIINEIETWKLRGKLAIHPNQDDAQNLEKLLGNQSLDSGWISALVSGYGLSGNLEAAEQSSMMALNNPETIANLALAIGKTDLEKSLKLTKQAKSLWTRYDAEWQPGLPQLYAWIAILKHTMTDQSERWYSAYQAIKNSLDIWDDEPKWHELAAQIGLDIQHISANPDYKDVIYHLRQAIELDPGNPITQLKLGLIYQEIGEFEDALKALGESTSLDPENGEAWLALAKAQNELGDKNAAMTSADEAVSKLALPHDAIMLRGTIALELNNPRGALSRVQSILNSSPNDSEALLLQALAYEHLNQPGEALISLQAIKENTSSNLEATLLQARLLEKLYGPQDALEQLESAPEDLKNDPRYLAALSGYLLQNNQTERAVQKAQLALQSSPQTGLDLSQRAHLYYMIGSISRKSGQLDQAIQQLDRAIEYRPDEVEYYLELGLTYQNRRQHDKAIETYRLAARISPNNYRPFYLAGLALKENKEYIEAENMFRRAAHLAPNEVTIHRQLAAVVALNLVHNRKLVPGD